MIMENLIVKIKKLNGKAVIPTYAHSTDAGMDLTAVSKKVEDGIVTYGTGLAFDIPDGYVGLIFPRSSIYKTDLVLANCVGVIDSGYHGEVKLKFRFNVNEGNVVRFVEGCDYIAEDCIMSTNYASRGFESYEVGDRIGQIIIMPYPKVTYEVTDKLDETERGTGGFGSTGIC